MRFNARMLAISLLGGGLMWAASRPAGAYNYWLYDGTPVVWADGESLRYLSASTFPPDSEPDILYRAAMGLWMLVPSADFEYYYYHLDFDPDIDNYDGYNDTTAVPASELDPGVLAATFTVNSEAQWYDMDTLFSDCPAGVGWNFEANPSCEVVTNPMQYGYSFLLASAHETGISLGLALDPLGTEPPGTSWFIATMNPRYPVGGAVGAEAIVEVHTDDRNGARVLYPHSGPSVTVIDLANPGYTAGEIIGKAVPAFFDPASVYPGEVLTLRSVIENFGNTSEFSVRQGFYLSTDESIETNDLLLGSLLWDLAFGDGFDFDFDVDMPADIAPGTYYVGSILDDLDEIAEEYEDNNTHVYCDTLTVAQLAPVINVLGQYAAPCGQPYTGPTPTVTHPLNMAPLTWSLDNPEPGMTVNPSTGVISWPDPVRSPFLYTLIVRATNGAGSATEILYLGVDQGLPQIKLIADQFTPHSQPYTGPTPQLTDPDCMVPILNWSLDAGPAGMTIGHATGVVSWDRPRYAAAAYEVSVRATNAIGNGIVTWNLHVTGFVGDLNCDGTLNGLDIDPFVLALTDPAEFLSLYQDCDPNLADTNGDGSVNGLDIDSFVGLLTGG